MNSEIRCLKNSQTCIFTLPFSIQWGSRAVGGVADALLLQRRGCVGGVGVGDKNSVACVHHAAGYCFLVALSCRDTRVVLLGGLRKLVYFHDILLLPGYLDIRLAH